MTETSAVKRRPYFGPGVREYFEQEFGKDWPRLFRPGGPVLTIADAEKIVRSLRSFQAEHPRPPITHNVFHGGAVQSLGFTTDDGLQKTIGVMLVGTWDFGIAKKQETINVITGQIVVQGKVYDCRSGPCVFLAGDRIIFRVREAVSYLCIYG